MACVLYLKPAPRKTTQKPTILGGAWPLRTCGSPKRSPACLSTITLQDNPPGSEVTLATVSTAHIVYPAVARLETLTDPCQRFVNTSVWACALVLVTYFVLVLPRALSQARDRRQVNTCTRSKHFLRCKEQQEQQESPSSSRTERESPPTLHRTRTSTVSMPADMMIAVQLDGHELLILYTPSRLAKLGRQLLLLERPAKQILDGRIVQEMVPAHPRFHGRVCFGAPRCEPHFPYLPNRPPSSQTPVPASLETCPC